MRKLNGFNNGRDTSSGVGGGPSPVDILKEHVAYSIDSISLRRVYQIKLFGKTFTIKGLNKTK